MARCSFIRSSPPVLHHLTYWSQFWGPLQRERHTNFALGARNPLTSFWNGDVEEASTGSVDACPVAGSSRGSKNVERNQ